MSKRRLMVRFAIAIAAISAQLQPAVPISAAPIDFPNDANLIDVRTFGARGDGHHDDTKALQEAINFAIRPFEPGKETFRRNATLLVPSGTYLVSDTLDYGSTALWAKRIILQGSGADRTAIRLTDRNDKFQLSKNPRALLSTFNGSSTNQAFLTQINDLTVDVGAGNPGAAGLRFIANNEGGLRNVRIKSSDPDGAGAIGLDLTAAWGGPAFFDQVTVTGFDVGMKIRYDQYSMTFRNLALERQRQIGIIDTDNSLTIDGLTSRNLVPVLRISGVGFVALARGMLTADRNTDQAAIEVEPGATLHMVDTVIQDYADGASGTAKVTLGSGAARSLVVSQGMVRTDMPAFELPAVRPLNIPDLRPDRWAKVDGFTGEAIARAFASGKPIIYFPFGQYLIARPIRIPVSVRRVVGFASRLKLEGTYPAGTPVLTIDPRRRDSLMMEGFDAATGAPPQTIWIKNSSDADILIRDWLLEGIGYRGDGISPPDAHSVPKILLENLGGNAKFDFVRQDVAAWQLNPESAGSKVRNEDGRLTIYGLKTENEGAILSTAGGETTVFGGLIFVHKNTSLGLPAFDLEGGRVCLSTVELSHVPAGRGLNTKFTILIGPPADGGKSVKKQPAKLTADFPIRTHGHAYPAICSP